MTKTSECKSNTDRINVLSQVIWEQFREIQFHLVSRAHIPSRKKSSVFKPCKKSILWNRSKQASKSVLLLIWYRQGRTTWKTSYEARRTRTDIPDEFSRIPIPLSAVPLYCHYSLFLETIQITRHKQPFLGTWNTLHRNVSDGHLFDRTKSH